MPLDEQALVEQRERDARAQAAAQGYRLGEPPSPDELRALPVIE